MLSKREKLYLAVERLPALACPTCGEILTRAGEGFACAAGHRVDVNRRGCLNVLSHQAAGCYDAALFEARRRVLAAGCYTPVLDALDALLQAHLPSGPQRLLDAGCGEGWYLNGLLARHPDWCGAGVDISRDAILCATSQPCTALWCVADLRRLPFRDGAFTAVLDVLTPASYDAFRRVLGEGGLLLKVYPEEGYLREIRAARGLGPYGAGRVDAYLHEKGHPLETRRVTAVQAVDDALWRDFVWMTPLNQDLTPEEKEHLARQNPGQVTIDLNVAAVRL